MSSNFTLMLLFFGLLSPFLVASGAVDCSEKTETLLRPSSNIDTKVTDCLMQCTGMTYIRKLQLQDNHNIRLQDSFTEEDLGEYCWSMKLKCTIGESFHSAYVVLPLDISAVLPEQLEVKVTAPTATTLHVDSSHSTIAETCGLRYDVTEHFSTATAGTLFCIQVINQEDVLGDNTLKCPPYLVTFWHRNPNYSNQQSGG